jgi:hypothetical protein
LRRKFLKSAPADLSPEKRPAAQREKATRQGAAAE